MLGEFMVLGAGDMVTVSKGAAHSATVVGNESVISLEAMREIVMMRVDGYDFGRIEIAGSTYTSDVIISDRHVRADWRRDQGHRLQITDLDPIMELRPEVLVVGTGFYGRMTVPEATRSYLNEMGIKMISAPTREAIDEFNRMQRDCASIVAALHLTC